MNAPSPVVRGHVTRLFRPTERDAVLQLLQRDCGAALPGAEHAPPEFFERIHCAVLKLSAGRMDKLRDAIALAQTDWRDLLVAAGFSADVQAHSTWTG